MPFSSATYHLHPPDWQQTGSASDNSDTPLSGGGTSGGCNCIRASDCAPAAGRRASPASHGVAAARLLLLKLPAADSGQSRGGWRAASAAGGRPALRQAYMTPRTLNADRDQQIPRPAAVPAAGQLPVAAPCLRLPSRCRLRTSCANAIKSVGFLPLEASGAGADEERADD